MTLLIKKKKIMTNFSKKKNICIGRGLLTSSKERKKTFMNFFYFD